MLGTIRKVLVANRGEIALRIVRGCKDLGIDTVAVYSEADKNSLHVKLADESVCIGPPQSRLSYLNIPLVIAAAEVTDADAIHPGYGFLSENAEFARVCRACNITFIGPQPENIELLGDKVMARATAEKAGVPMLPGSLGVLKDVKEAISEAERIGYPVMLKASGGGGGRGIVIIRNRSDMERSFNKTSMEAKAAFNNGAMFLERYLESPRHVEIQVAADQFGNSVHLGERDCTVQRRHQKVIEEAPCPVISQKTRDAMGEAALRLVRECRYRSLGTIEFLLDTDRESFYFLEMNTRIQVEHPVTEMVTGIDLVKLQLKIAAGEALGFDQSDVQIRGHSIECRINAEDPDTFAPCPGEINELHVPGGVGVRFDSFVYEGYTVPPYYDSMIGKLITHEENRELAIKKMLRALGELRIGGIRSNSEFQTRILLSEKFNNHTYGTGFLEEFLAQRD